MLDVAASPIYNPHMIPVIEQAFQKLQHDCHALRRALFLFHRGELAIVHTPRSEAVPLVATCYIINATSILEEALELFIDANFTPPHKWTDANGKLKDVKDLNGRIELLRQANKLLDASKLHGIRRKRNIYAHEKDQYGDWAELDQVMNDLEAELKNLSILS